MTERYTHLFGTRRPELGMSQIRSSRIARAERNERELLPFRLIELRGLGRVQSLNAAVAGLLTSPPPSNGRRPIQYLYALTKVAENLFMQQLQKEIAQTPRVGERIPRWLITTARVPRWIGDQDGELAQVAAPRNLLTDSDFNEYIRTNQQELQLFVKEWLLTGQRDIMISIIDEFIKIPSLQQLAAKRIDYDTRFSPAFTIPFLAQATLNQSSFFTPALSHDYKQQINKLRRIRKFLVSLV